MQTNYLKLAGWLPVFAFAFLVLVSSGAHAKPKLSQTNGNVKTEFKFGPVAMPNFALSEGDSKLESRSGSVTASTSDKSAVLRAHIEKLDPNTVVKILGEALLKEGDASISLQVNGVTRSRANLTSAGAKTTISFTGTLPKGEGDIVIELSPHTSLTVTQLRMEKLL